MMIEKIRLILVDILKEKSLDNLWYIYLTNKYTAQST